MNAAGVGAAATPIEAVAYACIGVAVRGRGSTAPALALALPVFVAGIDDHRDRRRRRHAAAVAHGAPRGGDPLSLELPDWRNGLPAARLGLADIVFAGIFAAYARRFGLRFVARRSAWRLAASPWARPEHRHEQRRAGAAAPRRGLPAAEHRPGRWPCCARRRGVESAHMSGLEEHTLESAGDRCEECGATLTERELQVVLERGGPTLCAIHARRRRRRRPRTRRPTRALAISAQIVDARRDPASAGGRRTPPHAMRPSRSVVEAATRSTSPGSDDGPRRRRARRASARPRRTRSRSGCSRRRATYSMRGDASCSCAAIEDQRARASWAEPLPVQSPAAMRAPQPLDGGPHGDRSTILPSLPPAAKRVVGRRRPVEREGLGDRHAQRAARRSSGSTLRSSARAVERLLLERAGAQRRGHDARRACPSARAG